MLFNAHVGEPRSPALGGEGLRLLIGPSVAGEPRGGRRHAPFDRQQSPSRGQHAPRFVDASADVFPMMHACHTPQDGRRRIRLPEIFRARFDPGNPSLLKG
jgi:hypothetical protein